MSSRLSLDELRAVLKDLGEYTDEAALQTLFRDMDPDGDIDADAKATTMKATGNAMKAQAIQDMARPQSGTKLPAIDGASDSPKGGSRTLLCIGSTGSTKTAKRAESTESVTMAYLGSTNHPEEEDELFSFRKMVRILGDKDQHNERLIHALNVLLAMSVVETNLARMMERGEDGHGNIGALNSLYHMMEHLNGLEQLFYHGENESSSSHDKTNFDFSEEIVNLRLHKAKAGVDFECRPPLFPSLLVTCDPQDEPFFQHLDDTGLQKLSRPPSFVFRRPSTDGLSDSERGVHVGSSPRGNHVPESVRSRDEKSSIALEVTQLQSSDSPLLQSPHTRNRTEQDLAKSLESKFDSKKLVQADVAQGFAEAQRGTTDKLPGRKQRRVFNPPPPAEVLSLSLKIIFNFSKLTESHRHIAIPNRLRFLAHVVSKKSIESDKLLGLRILINLSSNPNHHGGIVHAPGLLLNISSCLIDREANSKGEEDVVHGEANSNGEEAAVHGEVNLKGEDAAVHDVSPSSDHGSSKAHGSDSEIGAVTLKAITVFCNLSSNAEQAPEIYCLPRLLRLRLFSQDKLEKLAQTYGIDIYSFRRHEIEQLLVNRHKPNLREQLWKHHDVVKVLIDVVIKGSNSFKHMVLRLFVNLSHVDNIAFDMVEGEIDFLPPLLSVLQGILTPLADVLAEKEVVVVEVEEEEPVPDPRYFSKVQKFFEGIFNNIFEMWIFFDRHGNWSVSVEDIQELSKQLYPEVSGIKIADIVLILDYKKMKFLDPHDLIRAIAWHALPGDGKLIPLTRALDEARTRKKYIFSDVNQKMKARYETWLKTNAAAKEQERRNRIAARQAPNSTVKSTLKSRSILTEEDARRIDGESSPLSKDDQSSFLGKDDTKDMVELKRGTSAFDIEDDDEEAMLEDEGSDFDHEEYERQLEERRKKKEEEWKRKKMQKDLKDAFSALDPDDQITVELILQVTQSLCRDPEAHDRLASDLNVVQVILPLLKLDEDCHIKARFYAHEVLQLLDVEMEWSEVHSFDDESLEKLENVAKKWRSGQLFQAFNSWKYSVNLVRRHSISILQCYTQNTAAVKLPANAGAAHQALERFMTGEHEDGIWLNNLGVNTDCIRALSFALQGCDIHGKKRVMMDVVSLRFQENFLGLAQLDISNGDVRDEGLNYLVEAMIKIGVELLVLKAEKTNLSTNAGSILQKFLNECNDVEELWLKGNRLGHIGIKPLCKALRDHPNVMVLDVSANHINAPGGEELGALFTGHKSLKEVDCSWNDFSGEDGQMLLQGVSNNYSIVRFRACWNRFGKMAMRELKDCLNRISRAGVPVIWQELDLRHCGFDDAPEPPAGLRLTLNEKNRRPTPSVTTHIRFNLRANSRYPTSAADVLCEP